MPDFSGATAVTPHCILLAGNPQFPQELPCSAAITPGHLVEINAGLLRKHATADGNASPAFAREELTPNRTVTTQAIDTPYPSGDTVQWMICRPGDLVYAWVPASAAAIVAGDASPAFAREELTPNRTVTTQAIETPYPSGDTVQWMICRPGDLVYAWVPA